MLLANMMNNNKNKTAQRTKALTRGEAISHRQAKAATKQPTSAPKSVTKNQRHSAQRPAEKSSNSRQSTNNFLRGQTPCCNVLPCCQRVASNARCIRCVSFVNNLTTTAVVATLTFHISYRRRLLWSLLVEAAAVVLVLLLLWGVRLCD